MALSAVSTRALTPALLGGPDEALSTQPGPAGGPQRSPVVGVCVGSHPVQLQLIKGVTDHQSHRPCRYALTPMFGEHGPRQLAIAALHVLDLDRAGDPTLMLDQEDHGIALGGAVAAPKHYVAVMRGWPGGRNTHPCTLGEEPAYLLVRTPPAHASVRATTRDGASREATASGARDHCSPRP